MVTIVSSSRYKINKKQIKHYAETLLTDHHYGQSHALNIIFAGKTKLKTLALQYKKENEALPVLTFVYNEEADNVNHLGDIFICYPQAVLMAAQKNKGVDEMILRLVKHGMENIFNNV